MILVFLGGGGGLFLRLLELRARTSVKEDDGGGTVYMIVVQCKP